RLGLVCRRLAAGAGRARRGQPQGIPGSAGLPAASSAVQLFPPVRSGHGSATSNHFIAAIEAGTLPPVTFYKPQGDLNMHAGYASVEAGDAHLAQVVEALQKSPQWPHMLVVITVDENGGWWDHVAPPKGDRWGPGTRIPAIVVSPH